MYWAPPWGNSGPIKNGNDLSAVAMEFPRANAVGHRLKRGETPKASLARTGSFGETPHPDLRIPVDGGQMQ